MIEQSGPPNRSFFQCIRTQARILRALMLRTMHAMGMRTSAFLADGGR